MEIPTKFRIGALDLAALISEKIGSYVDMNFMQFLAADGNTVHLWYMNGGGSGPSVEITLTQQANGWHVALREHPAGTEQNIELP